MVPVVSYAGAQAPGAGHAGHAGALLQRPELNGHAAPSPAPSCDRAPACRGRCRVPLSVPPRRHRTKVLLLNLCRRRISRRRRRLQRPAPVPVLPVAAPSVSLPAASLASEPLRDDPFAELSPGPVSAAPLLHPQRQRELIEQAAGMSTRQVANLLAAAAPEVPPPRDTLRAAAPDRYTLKVSIDQECEQGLRLLKDLMSHVDPRMSWGDLVARVVREAVTRHDPRGGGSGQRRRRSADRAGASPRRAPKETRVVGAAVGPAQRGDESSPRAPNRARAAVAPGAPARRRGSATSAPQGDTATIERQNPIAMLANAAPPRQSAPAALLGRRPRWRRSIGRARRYFGAEVGARWHGWMAPGQAALHRARPPLLRRRSRRPRHGWMAPASAALDRARPPLLRRRSSRPAPWRMAPMPAAGGPGSPLATAAPKRALGVSPDRGPSGASAAGFSARAGVPGSPVATSAPQPALGVSPDGGPPDASAGAAAHTTREPVHSRHQSPPRRHIPAAVRRHVWLRDGGRCCYRDPLSGRRCTSSHLLQIDHLLPVAQGGGPEPFQLGSSLLCSSQNAPRLRTGCAAGGPDVAHPPRCWRAARLRWPTACRWPGGDTLRSPASPACIFATASSDPGRSLSMRSRTALSWSPVNDFLPLPAFARDGFRRRAWCAAPPRWRRPPCSWPPRSG